MHFLQLNTLHKYRNLYDNSQTILLQTYSTFDNHNSELRPGNDGI